MGTVTGLTAARMLAIEAASVVSGLISGDNLILTKHDGSTINAGNVRGPVGPQGPPGVSDGYNVTGGDVSGSLPTLNIGSKKVTTAKINDGAVTDVQVAAANKDGAAGTASMRTLGTGAQQAAAGNHGHTGLSVNGYFERTNTALQTIPHNTQTKVLVPSGALEGATYNASGVITITTAGVWVITASVQFAANATGRRILYLLANTSSELSRQEITPGAQATGLHASACHRFAANDTVELNVYQSSGANLDLQWAGSGTLLSFSAVRVAP